LLGFRIADAEIEGLDESGRRALERERILTAADIEDARLGPITEVGTETAAALLAWRRAAERGFDGDGSLSDDDRERVENEFADRRKSVEREIEQLLGALRSGAVTVRQQQKVLTARADAVAERIAQSEVDLKTVGNNTRLVLAMAAVTIVVPMIGATFVPVRPAYDRNSVRTGNTAPRSEKTTVEQVPAYQVTPGLTKKQIERMEADTRRRSAAALALEAEALMKQNDMAGAESKLNYAEIFDERQDDFLRVRAELLFRNRRFKDARMFNERREVTADNRLSYQIIRAKSETEMGWNLGAIETLQPIAAANKDSFDVNFWLGRAYRQNGEYSKGLEYLKIALSLTVDQKADVYSEMVRCYKGLGNEEDARLMLDALRRETQQGTGK
jgi:hypothetical protein